MSHSCYSISAHHLDACCGTMTNRVVNDSSNMLDLYPTTRVIYSPISRVIQMCLY